MKIKVDSGGYLVVSDEDRSILKTEFDKLQTIDEKYNFWQDKFDLNYSLNRHDNIQERTFTEFLITPTERAEIEELNKRIYSDWLELVPRFNEKTKVEKWREVFEDEIKSVSNKEQYIGYELGRIDNYVIEQGKEKRVGHWKTHIRPNYQFIERYEEYLKFKKEFDWGEQIFSPYDIKNLLAGIDCAKYREYVSGYLQKRKAKKEVELKLTGEQKVLALHYLGFCDNIEVGTQKGKVYEFFLDNFKYKSILKIFSNLTDYETEKNLIALIDFFRQVDIVPIAWKLEDKLNKLK